MKYIIDHDLHMHSRLSLCADDEKQTKVFMLKYAVENHLKRICVTDHFWDSTVPGASEWYKIQNYNHISQILPLPQTKEVKFYFGCETELDKHMLLGLNTCNYLT